jgi:hypothetical protein
MLCPFKGVIDITHLICIDNFFPRAKERTARLTAVVMIY